MAGGYAHTFEAKKKMQQTNFQERAPHEQFYVFHHLQIYNSYLERVGYRLPFKSIHSSSGQSFQHLLTL